MDAFHEQLLASHREEDDELDGPPTSDVIRARIACLDEENAELIKSGDWFAAGINALAAENWERRLAEVMIS